MLPGEGSHKKPPQPAPHQHERRHGYAKPVFPCLRQRRQQSQQRQEENQEIARVGVDANPLAGNQRQVVGPQREGHRAALPPRPGKGTTQQQCYRSSQPCPQPGQPAPQSCLQGVGWGVGRVTQDFPEFF